MFDCPVIFLRTPRPGHPGGLPLSNTATAPGVMARGGSEAQTGRGRALVCIGRSAVKTRTGQDTGLPTSQRADDWLSALMAADWQGDLGALLSRYARNHFALIAVDEGAGRVFAATDRFATRPLYWSRDRNGLMIGSDLALLVAQQQPSPTLAPEALFDYLYFHNIPAPRTVYREIAKLPPASLLCAAWSPEGGLSATAPTVDCWWRPAPTAQRRPSPSSAALKDALSTGLESEWPEADSACFLSGGLDSSTVAQMLGARGRRVDAFSIGFAGAGDYDELPFARISAKHAGARLHEKVLQPSDLERAIDTIAAAYAEPFGNSSAVPTLACAQLAREAGFTQLYAGDGGDELFAGNARYAEQLRLARLCRMRLPLKVGRRLLPDLPGLALRSKADRLLALSALDIPARLERFNFVHRLGAESLLTDDFLSHVDADAPLAAVRARFYDNPAPDDPLFGMLYLDWKFTLADSDLPKVTRMCEVSGIDVRYPLLTDPVVDFALSVPGTTLLRRGRLRAFYREAMQGFLSTATLAKSKHGFGLPFGLWLGTDPRLGERLDDSLATLRSRNLFQSGLLDEVGRLVRGAHPGYYGELAWILMMLEQWLRAHQPAYRL